MVKEKLLKEKHSTKATTVMHSVPESAITARVLIDSETNSVSQELRLAYKKSHVGCNRFTDLDSNPMYAGRKLYCIANFLCDAKKWELREKCARLARKLREMTETDEAKNLKSMVPRNRARPLKGVMVML